MGKDKTFLEELYSTVLVGDGAIGTELFVRGAGFETGVERLNLIAPDIVLKLHRDYVSAGSRIIETNTFAANQLNLEKYNARKEIREIVAAGVKLAQKAARNNTYVAGSVGPLPPVDGEPLSKSEQTELFTEPVESLVEQGVDLLIFETFIDLEQLVSAILVARKITDKPIIAQMAFEPGGETSGGDSASEFVNRCIRAGANVVGANCGSGIVSVIDAIDHMGFLNYPMSAYMNAGFAELIESRQIYLAPADYIASKACELVRKGVRIVGGCCGTNPGTVKAIVEALNRQKLTGALEKTITPSVSVREQKIPVVKPSEIPKPPRGVFVELDPPKKPEIGTLITCAEELKEAGVKAVTLADNPLASVRVDVLAVAGLLTQTGLPVIPHVTGRDRNRIALQSTIMGAHVLGIRSLLCVTGDPIRMHNETNTSGVFDVTSIGLVKLVSEFNSGQRLGGKGNTSFSIGVALNPNVRSIDGQIKKLQRKIEAGAHFALTQPVFDESRFDILQDALEKAHIKLPIYLGILPLMTARQADYLHFEVPGIYIPDKIRNKLHGLREPSDQRLAGIDAAIELVSKINPHVHGFYMITSFNKTENILPVIKEVKLQ
ncbi:MAG: bifunctional homocysteine S-methyltransferase/methylenetetrahydrofolate reductase [Candidatus Latescibacteria bacterium]|nr:bifunctional homocysteine S-methyltransferase/methylenetetrahydrofolate reductase [Candidatus Latescibacterota bacterium]